MIQSHFRNSTLLYLLYSTKAGPLAGSQMSVSIIWRHCNGQFGPDPTRKRSTRTILLKCGREITHGPASFLGWMENVIDRSRIYPFSSSFFFVGNAVWDSRKNIAMFTKTSFMALPKVSGGTKGKEKGLRKPQHWLAPLGKHRRDRVPVENKPAIKRIGYFGESIVVFLFRNLTGPHLRTQIHVYLPTSANLNEWETV